MHFYIWLCRCLSSSGLNVSLCLFASLRRYLTLWRLPLPPRAIKIRRAQFLNFNVVDVVENNGLKLQFSSWFLIHLLLQRLYRFYYQINSIYKCVLIESKLLHWSVSYLESLSCKIFLNLKWIETQLWEGNFNLIFSTTSSTS